MMDEKCSFVLFEEVIFRFNKGFEQFSFNNFALLHFSLFPQSPERWRIYLVSHSHHINLHFPEKISCNLDNDTVPEPFPISGVKYTI